MKDLNLRLLTPISYNLAVPTTGFISQWGMAWVEPTYSREEVNRAGEDILCLTNPETEWGEYSADKFHRAWDVVNNWRSIHGCPLQTIKMTLARRAHSIDQSAVVSQRTKRIPAILLKLGENHRAGKEMKLSQMQDIGGCRSILRNVTQVEELLNVYRKATAKNSLRGGIFQKEYDYILSPKETGYRGIHLVYKYYSDSKKLKKYNDLKIEIQIRSKLQHYWATAVETVDFFTGQALKSNIGDLPWKRFFILVSNEFARLEKRPLVPGAPVNEDESKLELKSFTDQINALEGFQAATNIVTKTNPVAKDGHFFLLKLDVEKKTIESVSFRKDQADDAQQAYKKSEEESRNNKKIQTVLVSVDSVEALKKAYPSFYLDITEFVKVLNRILGVQKLG
jgi:ppGpp synthetase/RelA/SpoT-type nucleotidyltranferase